MAASSVDSPEAEMASTMSSPVIMPRSPWLASLAWTNMAGVPVEASVAATLRPIWPLLPMPLTTTRPREARTTRTTSCTALPKAPSSASASCRMAVISVSSVRRAEASAPGPGSSAVAGEFAGPVECEEEARGMAESRLLNACRRWQAPTPPMRAAPC